MDLLFKILNDSIDGVTAELFDGTTQEGAFL